MQRTKVAKACPVVLGLVPFAVIFGIVTSGTAQPGGQLATTASYPSCLGDTRSLIIANGMPYTPVRVQGRTGFFVVDLGSDGSNITPAHFLGGVGSTPLATLIQGSRVAVAGVDFFGPWQSVLFHVQDSPFKEPLRQAGLIGTDLLHAHVITLDYGGGLLHRAVPAAFCRDEVLRRAGFRPLSSRDYYGFNPAELRCPAAPRRPCPNIPTIPVRVGTASAVAQVDTGYDDSRRPGVNINRAWLNQLQAAGVPLRRDPPGDISLSTCTGVSEPVRAYRLGAGTALELMGEDDRPVRRLQEITLLLKDTPAAARPCGGIGTWDRPAAQLGASSVNDGTLAVDPVGQRLWFRPGPVAR